jgi:selenoprotein W-related protein
VRATGLAAELLNHLESQIESITLLPGQGGRFEVEVDGKLIYSKLSTGRHAQTGEVLGLLKEYLIKQG